MMKIAYRDGSSARRAALTDWTNNPLEQLNEASIDSVTTKSVGEE